MERRNYDIALLVMPRCKNLHSNGTIKEIPILLQLQWRQWSSRGKGEYPARRMILKLDNLGVGEDN